MPDPATGERRTYLLPARTWKERLAVRAVPWFLWLGRYVDLDPQRAGDGPELPIPYGIDIAPDGGVWFSQLNAHRIGRLEDRKSTRLNSSHRTISYAVFCLKKKTEKI